MKEKETKGLFALFSQDNESSIPIWSSNCDDNIISLFSAVKDFVDFKNDSRDFINEPEEDRDEY